MYVYIILFQSVNKFPFPNSTTLKYIHTLVTRTNMTFFLYLVAEIPVLFLEVMRHSVYTAKHR